MRSYLHQKAAPWVSFSVLAGGLVSALMLSFLVKVERDVQSYTMYDDLVIEELNR